jgi:hypothetical protein
MFLSLLAMLMSCPSLIFHGLIIEMLPAVDEMTQFSMNHASVISLAIAPKKILQTLITGIQAMLQQQSAIVPHDSMDHHRLEKDLKSLLAPTPIIPGPALPVDPIVPPSDPALVVTTLPPAPIGNYCPAPDSVAIPEEQHKPFQTPSSSFQGHPGPPSFHGSSGPSQLEFESLFLTIPHIFLHCAKFKIALDSSVTLKSDTLSDFEKFVDGINATLDMTMYMCYTFAPYAKYTDTYLIMTTLCPPELLFNPWYSSMCVNHNARG